LVRELRQKGKTEEAREVAALRRPSPTLWIVNQLPKRAATTVKELIESTRRARRAQLQGRGGDELRDAMHAQREALEQLMREAEQIAVSIGVELNPQQHRRIQDTLESAAVAQPDALREGTLEEELSAAGFSSLIGGTEAGPSKAASGVSASAKGEAAAAKESRHEHGAKLDARAQAKRDAEARAEERRRQLAKERERMVRERAIQRARKEAQWLAAQAEQFEKTAEKVQSAAEQAQSKAAEARKAANHAAAQLLQLQKP
jgi:colicin import membrane protein